MMLHTVSTMWTVYILTTNSLYCHVFYMHFSTVCRCVRLTCKNKRQLSYLLTCCMQWYMQSDSDHERALFHLILRMLDYEPAQRIALSDAVKHAFFSPLRRPSPVNSSSQTQSPKTDDNARNIDVSRDQGTPVTSWVAGFRWTARCVAEYASDSLRWNVAAVFSPHRRNC